jgi:hypothetical protein
LRSNRILYKLYFGILLGIPLFLLALPSSYFDNTGYDICLSKILFNKECLGCGITRAVMHFIHFEFAIAFSFNKLVIFVIPFLIYLWIDAILFLINKLKTH